MNEYLILVDENDRQLGKQEKLLVHQLGLLHRAFSVFVFNTKGELLLQQRADEKYHSPGIWTNTCCSHPNDGEELKDAVNRRLIQEMGMSCKTQFAFSFIYKVKFENGLTENEYDHVFFGVTDDLPKPEKQEVKDWKYISLTSLETEINQNPENYSEWMKICLPELRKHIEKNKNMNKFTP
ncbi:MAG: isopentenyl-diphosphate Delta-isomerase [Bacteroidota bacterium]|nr:isopentenyl-diphosphate Delta-isomerase [Bacteroidota bacterium]